MGLISRQNLRRRRLAALGLGLGLAIVSAIAGLIWVSLAILAVTLWRASRHVGVPVIVYHAVSDDVDWLPWADNIAIRPRIFAQQMAHIAKSGWQVIPSWDLHDAQRDGTDLPKRTMILHFDDAYLDFWTNVRPILHQHNLPATVFASSDFIDPSTGLRDSGIGYMNADELRAAHADPLLAVASHGKDHARLQIGPAHSPRKPKVWGKETAWLWSRMPGNKARWFDQAPPDVETVPENDSALCARQWTSDAVESLAARDARVVAALTDARQVLSETLNSDVRFLCWPFDRCDQAAIANAQTAGFTFMTGGTADNQVAGGVVPLSRTHINDHAAGGGPDWIEVIVFRAKLEVAAGNLLFWPIAAAASVLRRRRFAILHDPAANHNEVQS